MRPSFPLRRTLTRQSADIQSTGTLSMPSQHTCRRREPLRPVLTHTLREVAVLDAGKIGDLRNVFRSRATATGPPTCCQAGVRRRRWVPVVTTEDPKVCSQVVLAAHATGSLR